MDEKALTAVAEKGLPVVALEDGVRAGNLIVLKTLTGSASAAAEAIDGFQWPEIIGTIAGDNTILVIIKNIEDVDDIIGRFHEMIGNRK